MIDRSEFQADSLLSIKDSVVISSSSETAAPQSDESNHGPETAMDAMWQLAELFLEDEEGKTDPHHPRPFSVPTSVHSFSERQRTIIRASWRILAKHRDDVGIKIYQTIFDCAPTTKRMFPFVKHDGDGELIINKQAHTQASRFMQLYENVADNITDVDQIIPVLRNLGTLHSRYRGFEESYWFVFEDSTLLVFRKYFKKAGLSTLQTDECIVLWRVLISWVINHIREACSERIVQRGSQLM